MSYQLVRGPRYTNSGSASYTCRNASTWEPLDGRVELPSSNPFDFYTYIRTKLNILVMGDSLAVEFGTWFQSAGQATNNTVLEYLQWWRSVAEGMALAEVDGGGSISYWRILGLWKRGACNGPLPNSGRGWRDSWVITLQTNLPDSSKKVDVLIFRVSHPWLRPDEVTYKDLDETVSVAHEYLG